MEKKSKCKSWKKREMTKQWPSPWNPEGYKNLEQSIFYIKIEKLGYDGSIYLYINIDCFTIIFCFFSPLQKTINLFTQL